MKNNLILTGCAGFIGLNFLKRIWDSGSYKNYDSIISIDKMGYATVFNRDVYSELCQAMNIIRIDLDVLDLIEYKTPLQLNSLYDVVDFASESHVDNSIDAPFLIFYHNSMIPANLISWINKHGKIKNYYHISTDEVYGDLPFDVSYDDWFDTNSNISPNNPYSASKAAQDCYLHAFKHTFGLSVKFIRMANQFGPWQHCEKMIPASLLRVFNGEPIKVYGEGKNVRQWTYVEDTVKVIEDIVLQNIESDYVTHIADPKNLFDNNFIVAALKENLIQRGFDPKIEYVKDRLGHDKAYALKVKSNISTYFSESFENTLANTIDFYYNNFKKNVYGKGQKR